MSFHKRDRKTQGEGMIVVIIGILGIFILSGALAMTVGRILERNSPLDADSEEYENWRNQYDQ